DRRLGLVRMTQTRLHGSDNFSSEQVVLLAGTRVRRVIEEPVIQRVLSAALKTGGEFAEVFVEDDRSTMARLDDGKVEELTSGRERGAGIRVIVGETTGFAHTADLSESGLTEAATAAAAAARQGGGGVRTVGFTKVPVTSAPVRIPPESVTKE